MAHRFINELQAGQMLEDEVFLIRSKDLRTTTQGKLYIHAILVDRTGELVTRMWQATEAGFQSMPEGGFLRFKGRVENYKGNLQFVIDAMRPAEEGSYELGDFVSVSSRDLGEMWTRTVEIMRGVKNPDLAALIEEFLADQGLMDRFRKAPAAAVMHHAFIGGLMEHTLNILEMALRVIPLYPQISLDLVLTAIFLHDLGKSAELACDTTITYTDNGQLIGHLVLATMWIEKKADAVGAKTGRPFPEQLRWVLQHIVLSHHGQYEFGSPKLPAVPEAVAVHYLDNIDAKLNMFLGEIDKDRDPASRWTNYHRALETKIYKPDVMGTRGGCS